MCISMNTFGAFAPSPWMSAEDTEELYVRSNLRHHKVMSQKALHSQKSFLFSITLDLKIPYHGRETSGNGGAGEQTEDNVQILGDDFLSFGSR